MRTAVWFGADELDLLMLLMILDRLVVVVTSITRSIILSELDSPSISSDTFSGPSEAVFRLAIRTFNLPTYDEVKSVVPSVSKAI